MQAQDFLDWMEAMGFRKATQVADALDMSRNLAQRWVKSAQAGDDLEIKRSVALAMSALEQNLKPWSEK